MARLTLRNLLLFDNFNKRSEESRDCLSNPHSKVMSVSHCANVRVTTTNLLTQTLKSYDCIIDKEDRHDWLDLF